MLLQEVCQQRRKRNALTFEVETKGQVEPARVRLFDIGQQFVDFDDVVMETFIDAQNPACRAQGGRNVRHPCIPRRGVVKPIEVLAGRRGPARKDRGRHALESEAGELFECCGFCGAVAHELHGFTVDDVKVARLFRRDDNALVLEIRLRKIHVQLVMLRIAAPSARSTHLRREQPQS